MGSFFTNIQIRNEFESKEVLIEQINKALKKRNMVSATEEDATYIYKVLLSSNGKWATLCTNQEEDNETILKNVKLFAKEMKTGCFSVTTVDSDFAILDLVNGKTEERDSVLVGDGSGYDMSDNPDLYGKEECWKPFLEAGSTWAEFTESKSLSSAFVEDSLCNIAALIGLDDENILADYESRGDTAEGNTIELFYKNKATKQVSIETKMKNAFAELIEPHGFKKVKGKYPYFAKLIGNEILEVIALKIQTSLGGVGKDLDIYCGITTVYNSEIDLKKSPRENRWWINHNYLSMFDRMYNICDIKPQRPDYPIVINNYDEKIFLKKIEHAIEITEKCIIPLFNTVTNLKSCLEYFQKYDDSRLHMYSKDELFSYEEGLLYLIVCKNVDEYAEFRNEILIDAYSEIRYEMKHKLLDYTEDDYERKKEELQTMYNRVINEYKIFYYDNKYRNAAMKELEKRKKENTEQLVDLGLITTVTSGE